MVHRLLIRSGKCYFVAPNCFIITVFCACLVFSNYPDYVNFNEQQNKKSYANQQELFPCPKLYEFCGDVGFCCEGLQCTDATFEQDTKDYVFERFFCGNASKSYNENLQGLRDYIKKFERDGFV